MRTRLGVVAALVLAAAVLIAAPAAIPPAPDRWVTDATGFLSDGTRRSLDGRLEAYERSTGHQVLVWIGPTSGPTPPEEFAARAFESWRVGRKGIDDGLVLFIFAEDRKARFEVGYGLEDKVPDAIASRIIREVMVPRLQSGDRDGAVEAGVDAALSAIGRAAAEPPPAAVSSRPLSTAQKVIIAILVIGFLLILITNPSLAFWLLVNVLSSGRSGGSSGGGGGWSGGGGRSGGGGATGSW